MDEETDKEETKKEIQDEGSDEKPSKIASEESREEGKSGTEVSEKQVEKSDSVESTEDELDLEGSVAEGGEPELTEAEKEKAEQEELERKFKEVVGIERPEQFSEDKIRELEKLRDRLNVNAEEHKAKRDRLNDKTKRLINQREKINSEVKKLIRKAAEHKERRNQLNEEVRTAKGERETLNRKANEAQERAQKLRREFMPKDEGPSLGKLRRERKELEFKLQTQVHSRDAEREIVDQLSKLQQQIEEREKKVEQNEEVRQAVKNSRETRQAAEAQHKLVSDLAEKAQKEHDAMVSLYEQSDELRKKMDVIQEELIKTKMEADEEHKLHITLIRQVHDYDKIIYGMRRKFRRARKAKTDTSGKKQQEEIMEKFKRGEKLSTEDLMTLQTKN
jgi:uncharacterized coiled-coil DUF342 family protein